MFLLSGLLKQFYLFSRCVLCGRTFKHYANLQVHLTGHLGVKVNIHRCGKCKKNFRNKLELQLHLRSHLAAKMLSKNKNSGGSSDKVTGHKAKIITTAGSTDKKIIRKYLKNKSEAKPASKVTSNKDNTSLAKADKKKSSSALKQANDNLTCALCDKSFGVKSLYLRHVKKSHPELAQKMEFHSQLRTQPSINIKKCNVNNSPAPSTPTRTPTSAKTSVKKKLMEPPLSPTKSPIKSPMRQYSTPTTSSTTKSKKERTKSESLAPALPDYYNTLECPDCERVFIAKSIFERHLQSAKHGIYSQCNSSNDSELDMSPVTPVPHWTQSPISPHDSGSGSPHKIECHLCGQSFVRVKDLAKHREKMCQAYHA